MAGGDDLVEKVRSLWIERKIPPFIADEQSRLSAEPEFAHEGTNRPDTAHTQVDHCHITAVAPQVPSYVVRLLINDNTPVKEGDLLVQIDPREYQAIVQPLKSAEGTG
jgi:multidrug efflux pump subunit AcrA (membrane-fusion protein)